MKLSTISIFAITAAASAHAITSGQSRDHVKPRDDAPNFGYNDLYAMQQNFYDNFVYPNNIKQRNSINSTVFSEDVQGRVSDTRNFVGRELNTEYIFGLFSQDNGLSVIGLPIDYEIIQFSAQQNIAAASTRVDLAFSAFGNITLPTRVDTWITWNSLKQITQYDVTFRWFGYLLKTLMSMGSGTPEENVAKLVDGMGKQICQTHETYCNGTNKQFDSTDKCYDFLTKQIRVGESFELGMNTLLCRNVHEIMVPFRPDVHCSHIGPSGGGMCDDSISYVQKVDELYFTNDAWIPTQAS